MFVNKYGINIGSDIYYLMASLNVPSGLIYIIHKYQLHIVVLYSFIIFFGVINVTNRSVIKLYGFENYCIVNVKVVITV